ncbi:hypothetical protein HDU76_010001, partial [Blyttiomyces sp. JEL0837]
MSRLQEKYEITEFRLRANILQAIEYLKHAARSLVHGHDSGSLIFVGNSSAPLPLYE